MPQILIVDDHRLLLNEYFTAAWNKTYKGYYPREFYEGKKLLETLEMLHEIGSDR